MKRSLYLALVLALLPVDGCIVRQVNTDVHDLHSLTVQATTKQQAQCTAPAPQAGTPQPAVKPAACTPLLDCIEHAATASATCKTVMTQFAQTGNADTTTCTAQYNVAVAACNLVGIQPQKDTPISSSSPGGVS